jgi:pimeloyl-ACP methyl ester carboxylesterase
MRWLSLLLACSCFACGAIDAQADLNRYQDIPRVGGEVTVDDWEGEPIIVVALREDEREGAPPEVADRVRLYQPGKYLFLLEPATYRLGAFVDENRDGRFQPDERVGVYNGFQPFEISSGSGRRRADLQVGQGRLRDAPEEVRQSESSYFARSGTVVSLSDERFEPSHGSLGMWMPMRFSEEVGGGLFFLEEYDPDKTPVVFVHGIAGHPREFSFFIDSLDREHFQPWVVQYPSGMQVSVIAEVLNRVLDEIVERHDADGLCIVAHSMGGVVVRRTLGLHVRNRPRAFIRSFVTIDSPLGGMESAAMGAEMSPLVVPAWVSLIPGGQLLSELYDTPLPEGLEYTLLFAHVGGSVGSDNTVGLASQLRPEALEEADYIYGFRGTHTGVLTDEAVATRVTQALDRCRELGPLAGSDDANEVTED